MEAIVKSVEDTKDLAYQSALVNNCRNSYISKQDFIEILSKLNFDRIESAHIHFITSYEYIPKDDKRNEYVKTFGYDLDIS